MPKSKEKVCVIQWEGRQDMADFESFTRFSLLKTEQFRALPYLYINPAVIDLCRIKFEDTSLILPFLLRIVANLPAGTQCILPSMSSIPEIKEINTAPNLEAALSSIAFGIKQKRHDGGKSIVEPIHYEPIKLSPIDLRSSTLVVATYSFHNTDKTIGLISFEGHYAKEGDEQYDALFIQWKLSEFAVLGRFGAILVDLRKLDNIIGEQLDIYPSGFTGPEDKIAFLIQDGQRQIIKHYIFDGDEGKIFTNEKEALAFLKE